MFTFVKVNDFSHDVPAGMFSHWELRLDASHEGKGLTLLSSKKLNEIKKKYGELVLKLAFAA